jgi:N-acetylglucosaminyl-diphospho-decaprenol L-rhamnosyltransferase
VTTEQRVAALMGAVVVNHDAGDALPACVASLRRAGIEQIVVVDNASRDGSLVNLAMNDRDVGVLPTGANLGYGTAANRGVARLATEFVLVCNPDLELDERAPTELVAALRDEPDLGICGPQILQLDGAIYPSGRAFPSFVDAAGHALFGMFAPQNRFSRRYRLAALDRSGAVEVDWVSGACMAVRSVAFSSVGGFDEAYFMYVEDLDLCWRVKRAGWRVRYVPTAEVTHTGGVSAARHPYRMLAAHHRSTWRFARVTTRGHARLLLPAVGLLLAARLGVALARESAREGAARRAGQRVLKRRDVD